MNDLLKAPAMVLSKFDVAERQLLQAIRMFFAQQDSVSIHTLSEAAGQILHDYGKVKGVVSFGRDSDLIRPEGKKEWFSAIFRSRNFFKHAEKDADSTHEFKDAFNDFSLLDSVNMYSTLKRRWTPETLLFIVWFGIVHPDILRDENELKDMLEIMRRQYADGDLTEKAFVGRTLEALRSGRLTVLNVTLEYGLPE